MPTDFWHIADLFEQARRMSASGGKADIPTLTWTNAFGDDDRHVPVLPGRHLDALKIQEMLLPRLQVVEVKHADDLLPLDHIAGVDSPMGRGGAYRYG